MANQLKMAEQHVIVRLAENGWSYPRIARELGIHRETVARYVDLARGEFPKPAISITGSEPPEPRLSGFRPLVHDGGGPDSRFDDGHSNSQIDDSHPGSTPTISPGSKPAISIAGAAGRRSLCARSVI